MKICAFDYETNGLDTAVARATEWGANVFETGEELAMLARAGGFIYAPDYAPQSEEIREVTGITDEMLIAQGVPFPASVRRMANELPAFDAFLAHNAEYDRGIFNAELERHRGEIPDVLYHHFKNLPWICSIQDVEYPIRTKCRVLSHLALEMGMIVDPSKLHRALDDCDLLVEVMANAKVDFQKALAHAITPWVLIRAVVPKPFGPGNDGGVGKEKAKACGFGWQKAPRTDGPEFPNCWVKRVKENEVQKEKEALGYEVKILEA